MKKKVWSFAFSVRCLCLLLNSSRIWNWLWILVNGWRGFRMYGSFLWTFLLFSSSRKARLLKEVSKTELFFIIFILFPWKWRHELNERRFISRFSVICYFNLVKKGWWLKCVIDIWTQKKWWIELYGWVS